MAELRTESRTEWTSAPRETGDRDFTCGHDSFQVTGDGDGYQPFGGQPFNLQPPEAWCQLLMAERPTPELPIPVPVTWLFVSHYTQYSMLSYSTFALLHAAKPHVHLCTAPVHPLPTGQPINWSTYHSPLSPCPRVPSPFLHLHRSPF